LYQTARLTAVTCIRSEIRRTRREREAHMQTVLNETESDVWPQIAPLLDAAMAGLNETDRHAMVLRFFDERSMGEVGAALGASEDAAKKRVHRAVERLRLFFHSPLNPRRRNGEGLDARFLRAVFGKELRQPRGPRERQVPLVRASKLFEPRVTDQHPLLLVPQPKRERLEAGEQRHGLHLMEERIGFVTTLQIIIRNPCAQMVDVVKADVA